MFVEPREKTLFEWSMIGDIELGRPNLGPSVNIALYRLMQFTLRDTLIKELGPSEADQLFYQAGKVAGSEFCKTFLDTSLEFSQFIKDCQKKLMELKIGIMRVEKADINNFSFIITIAEDLDCSGLTNIGETICAYDEGFLSGIFNIYTGKEFRVKEIDCWCSGERVCRFSINQIQD